MRAKRKPESQSLRGKWGRRRWPTLTFPTLSLHGKLTPQGTPGSSSRCLQNDNGMASAENGSYGQMFQNNYFSTDLLRICEIALVN